MTPSMQLQRYDQFIDHGQQLVQGQVIPMLNCTDNQLDHIYRLMYAQSNKVRELIKTILGLENLDLVKIFPLDDFKREDLYQVTFDQTHVSKHNNASWYMSCQANLDQPVLSKSTNSITSVFSQDKDSGRKQSTNDLISIFNLHTHPESMHIFVGDLAPDVNDYELLTKFSVFGSITECKIIKDMHTQKPKGYGFISFTSRQAAENAIQAMNGRLVGSRIVRTNWAVKRDSVDQARDHRPLDYVEVYNAAFMSNTTIYVGGLSTGLSENLLHEAFEEFGCIEEVRIFREKGFSFIRFESHTAAAKAIVTMHGKLVGGSACKCSWSKEPMHRQVKNSGLKLPTSFEYTNLIQCIKTSNQQLSKQEKAEWWTNQLSDKVLSKSNSFVTQPNLNPLLLLSDLAQNGLYLTSNNDTRVKENLFISSLHSKFADQCRIASPIVSNCEGFQYKPIPVLICPSQSTASSNCSLPWFRVPITDNRFSYLIPFTAQDFGQVPNELLFWHPKMLKNIDSPRDWINPSPPFALQSSNVTPNNSTTRMHIV